MRIRVEPKEFFMYAVFLYFNQERPDPEDAPVKAYLEEHELAPKLQGTDKKEDGEFDVMYFGGCYLGKHLKTIEDIQRAAVEKEMLTLEIRRALQESGEPSAGDTQEPPPEDAVDRLVREFLLGSSFAVDEQGYLKVILEPGAIRQRFAEMAG